MVFIEASRAVEAAGSGELRDGAVMALAAPAPGERESPATSPAAALRAGLAAKAGDRRRK